MLKDTRLLCSDLVALEWSPTIGGSLRAAAILDDISRRGACLQLEHPIPAETMVKLICGRCELQGKVRSCRYRHGIGYYVGIAFAEDCSWSKERYRPSHLTDPGQLSHIQPVGCKANSPCEPGQPCPHPSVTEAVSGGNSAEKVRKVAREVARVCHNLDLGMIKTCYRHLYEGHRGDELLDAFVDAYYEELAAPTIPEGRPERSREAQAGSSEG